MINKIQHEQYCHGLGEQQSSLNMRESSTALALEFVDAHELAQHLQEFKDLLKKVQKLGLGEEFVSSMNRSALHAGVELAMFQAVINEQNNREIRKNNDKVFQKNLKKSFSSSFNYSSRDESCGRVCCEQNALSISLCLHFAG